MKVVLVEPEKRAYVKEIEPGLESMQEIVGGCIQILYPFQGEIALVCNDESKLLGLPLNRSLRDEEGRLYDIVSGAFFLCGAPADSDELTGLTAEQEAFCLERFGAPELFLQVNGQLMCIPVTEKAEDA